MSRDAQRLFVERDWFGRTCTAAMRPAIEAAFDELRPNWSCASRASTRRQSSPTSARDPVHHGRDLQRGGRVGRDHGGRSRLPDAVVARCASSRSCRASRDARPIAYARTYRYAEAAAPESTRELVYATFGTVAPKVGYGRYRALLDAVDGLDVPVLFTTASTSTSGRSRPTSQWSAGCRSPRRSPRRSSSSAMAARAPCSARSRPASRS